MLFVTFSVASHQSLLRDPFVAFAPRFCLFASLNPQNFDYANCFAVFFAQDDTQGYYAAVCFQNGRFVNRPYGGIIKFLVGTGVLDVPKTIAHRLRKRAIRESPIRRIIKFLVGTGVPDGPKKKQKTKPRTKRAILESPLQGR